ncbi:hypothetical protein N7507_002306 [Penicillium longicatenatum]|nr:hypothetical protein N7507_002306 [Penicillium longicatenatum]
MEGSHSWRSQWLRLLDPNPRDQQERHLLEATKTRTELARKKAAECLMANFLATSAAFLINAKPLDVPRLAPLQLIFNTAAQISHKLWLRKSYLEIQTIRSLPKTYLHTNERLNYHSLHNEFLSAEETGLDGYPIIVVTHPAVLVHGNSDGSNYGAPPRIWKEARVWMG